MNIRFTEILKATMLLLLVSGLYACRKDEDTPEPVPEKLSGVFVLNEGNFSTKNSTLSYHDFISGQTTSDIFGVSNAGLDFGDTGQDLIIYGSKTYISVHGSSRLYILDTKTSKIIKSIKMLTAESSANALPRYLASAKGKVFISAYDDKVYVLDTASQAIQKSIPVGRDPEHLAVVGEKLYVANSGGLGIKDNTVSIIDLNTLTELKKIVVGLNNNQVVADKYGDIYVTSRGDYDAVRANLYRVNTANDQVTALNISATGIAINGDIAYIYKSNWINSTMSYDKGYLTLNVQTEIVGPSFIKDGTDASIEQVYGIGVDPTSGDIFIADAKDFTNPGDVYCFGTDGKKKYTFKAGVIPSRFVFYRN